MPFIACVEVVLGENFMVLGEVESHLRKYRWGSECVGSVTVTYVRYTCYLSISIFKFLGVFRWEFLWRYGTSQLADG